MMKTKTWLVVGMVAAMAASNAFGRGSGHSRASMGRSSGRSTFGIVRQYHFNNGTLHGSTFRTKADNYGNIKDALGYMHANMAALKQRMHIK